MAALRTAGTEYSSTQARNDAADGERRLLRTVFQDSPVPLFLLERDGTVRRVNRQAGALLGSSAGYLTGKPFPRFCDLATRATVGSHVAGVFHSGRRRRSRVRLLSGHGPVEVDITFARIWVTGEPDPLVIAATAPSTREPAAQDLPQQVTATDDAVATVVHRMDVLATATAALLEDQSFTESVALRRCARLLAAELADWVFIDLAREGSLLRQVVDRPGRRTQHRDRPHARGPRSRVRHAAGHGARLGTVRRSRPTSTTWTRSASAPPDRRYAG